MTFFTCYLEIKSANHVHNRRVCSGCSAWTVSSACPDTTVHSSYHPTLTLHDAASAWRTVGFSCQAAYRTYCLPYRWRLTAVCSLTDTCRHYSGRRKGTAHYGFLFLRFLKLYLVCQCSHRVVQNESLLAAFILTFCLSLINRIVHKQLHSLCFLFVESAARLSVETR